jgi:hypothetical protein
MRPPSGANTALVTESMWPGRVASGLPSRSRSRAVLSLEAVSEQTVALGDEGSRPRGGPVTRIDRLARSIGDQDIVRQVKGRGASLKATEQPIDTGTAAGKCFLDMLGVFAEFETNLRRERQLEGIARAKAEGVYKGRPASIDAARVRELKGQGLGATEIAKTFNIGRASVYRVLGATP